MKNLKLISKLQPSDMVTLLLVAHPGEQLDYYIVARSINYSIIASGKCEGSIIGPRATFNILLSSLYPLLDKGYVFRIKYTNDILEFVSADERIRLCPLCVQYQDPGNDAVISKFMRLQEALIRDQHIGEQLAKAESEYRAAQQRYNNVSQMRLEGAMVGSNPFGDVEDLQPNESLLNDVKEKSATLAVLSKQSKQIKSLSLKPFKTLASAASRGHELVNFCDDYAIVALKNTFLLQRGVCPTMSVQGPLLYQLLSYGDGDGFFWFENGLVYSVGGEEKTTVFMEKYLPNISVDKTIVTRGTTLEQYKVRMKGILAVTQLMKSKFPDITFDLGESLVVLENEKGERLESKFEIDKAWSPQLEKALRGESVPGGVTMAKFSVPSDVQSMLGLFRDETEIYIKARKVIFKSDGLYLVFGR